MIPSTLGGRGDHSVHDPDCGIHRSSVNYDHLTRWSPGADGPQGPLSSLKLGHFLPSHLLHSTAVVARASERNLTG